jgi:hypothetical protein
LLEKIEEFFVRISRGRSSRIFETNNLRFLEELSYRISGGKMGYFWRKRWQFSTNIVLVDIVGGFLGKK